MSNSVDNIVVLLSGGVDSAACIQYYISRSNNVEALYIDYGQPAAVHEFAAAQSISEYYKVPIHVIAIKGAQSSAPGFINGRNALLLNIALLYKINPTGIVSIGIHSGSDYPDCSETFLHIMQSLYDLYTNGLRVIDAPFLHWKKSDIWHYCKNNHVPIEITYSCETGSNPPCNKCHSCLDIMRLQELEQ